MHHATNHLEVRPQASCWRQSPSTFHRTFQCWHHQDIVIEWYAPWWMQSHVDLVSWNVPGIMARISRPMTNVALRLLAWVLNLSLIATCRATSPACEITFDNAMESFASIDWNLCPPLPFRASMSGFCLSAGCNQASHAARSPSLAARHTLLIRSDCQTPKFWCLAMGWCTPCPLLVWISSEVLQQWKQLWTPNRLLNPSVILEAKANQVD